MKMLIVDDHILFRQGLIDLFESEPDIEIVGDVGTIAEAIRVAKTSKPDLILMDFGLPDGTGVEATKEIIKILPECKIVFLTVHPTHAKLIEAVRAGAKGYLLKNLAIDQLISALRGVYTGEAAVSRTMMIEIMDELSQTDGHSSPDMEIFSKLTNRELEILREIGTNASNREIAQRLFISENTVKHHIYSIMEKLNLPNRREAARIAKESGIT
jgi:DNA-binding NarL/FixJ family response regulator